MQETEKQSDLPARSCPACNATLHRQPMFCPICGIPLVGTTGRLQPNRVLAGRYRIVQLLARGGMGAVYLAEDTRLAGAQVAVKEMASDFTRGDTEAFARAVAEFEREAAMLARLRHPHLPRVSDLFDEAGKHYLVMEYIHGLTLRAVIQQASGRLPLDQALDYADQLCDVLAYLHSQQPPIIYRDLKPANVMVVAADAGSTKQDGNRYPSSSIPHPPSSQIVLIDFGIARFYRPDRSSDTAVYGTIGYAPPEQYGKGQTDARTDIYALGVLLHHALTGHDPVATPFALPPPRSLNPSIPPAVAAAIERATANDREARFVDVAAFRAALRSSGAASEPAVVRREGRLPAQAGLPNIAATSPAATAARPTAGGFPVRAIGLVGTLLTVVVVLLMLLRFNIIAGQPATPTPEQAIAATSNLEPTAAPELSPGPARTTPVVLVPSGVSASSHSAPGIDAQQNEVTYEPEHAIDGRNDTAWRVDGDGQGEWLQLDFDGEVEVQKIGIIPGYDKIDPGDGTDRFAQNRAVKRAQIAFSDGSSVDATFARQREMQFVELPSSVRTRSIRIVIEETYPPPPVEQDGRDFTPISEVQVQGTR